MRIFSSQYHPLLLSIYAKSQLHKSLRAPENLPANQWSWDFSMKNNQEKCKAKQIQTTN